MGQLTLSAPLASAGAQPGLNILPWMRTRIHEESGTRGAGGSEDPPQRAPETPISQEMNTHARRAAQRVIPTSVKKPAIPAWQEPCSSPYFFLYSRGGEEGGKQTTASSSVCQACAERPRVRRGQRLGTPCRLGAEGKSQESTRPRNSRAPGPSGSKAAKCPMDFPLHVGKEGGSPA